MQCDYFDDGRCASCRLMGQPYPAQVAAKQQRVEHLLAGATAPRWSPPATAEESAYRNKAKMVVGGTLDSPTIGILDADGHGVDLQACGICSPGHRAAFPILTDFIRLAGLRPYQVPTRTGELKHLLLTESPDDELMLRFVLRSTEPVARIRKHLPWLLERLPGLRVVSVNLLPHHKAAVEGEQEILLTEQDTLPMRLGEVTLHLRTRSFFQTNTAIATALYRQAADWVEDLRPRSLWDLYCGVGGFALHLAHGADEVVGVETSEEAVLSARRSAAGAGLDRVRFVAGDASSFAVGAGRTPELVVVNPPRRGIGAQLCDRLDSSDVRWLLYSSCNPVTLAKDLAAMPSLRPLRARLFDMFPQTDHTEVLVLAERATARTDKS